MTSRARSHARRSVPAVIASFVAVGLLVSSASAGVRTPSVAKLAPIVRASAPNYSPDPPASFKRLNAGFVRDAVTNIDPGFGVLHGPRSAATGTGTGNIVRQAPDAFTCVNGHQTEDPSSPPCAAPFSGDNGGATYQGVTGDEVRVLVPIRGAYNYAGVVGSGAFSPDHQFVDVGEPAKPEDFYAIKVLRAYQDWFNKRYQTYGRRVRFIVYFGGSDRRGAAKLGDAVDAYLRARPFAALFMAPMVPEISDGPPIDLESGLRRNSAVGRLASLGVATFLGFGVPLPESFWRAGNGRAWNYGPSTDVMAQLYASFVCQRLRDNVANVAGDAALNGTPRRFGVLRFQPTDPGHYPFLSRITAEVEAVLSRCGVTPIVTRRFRDVAGGVSVHESPAYALEAMRAFKDAGVTTVLVPSGVDANFSRAASAIRYHPEWIINGDTESDSPANAEVESPEQWNGHAVVITTAEYVPPLKERHCTQPLEEGGVDYTADLCLVYEYVRLLFTGVQLAGPRLTPTAIDAGMHAVPGSPTAPPYTELACSFPAGAYTCVHDALVEIWQTGRGVETSPTDAGCYTVVDRGKRSRPWEWGTDNIHPAGASDRCNNYDSHYGQGPYLDLRPPEV